LPGWGSTRRAPSSRSRTACRCRRRTATSGGARPPRSPAAAEYRLGTGPFYLQRSRRSSSTRERPATGNQALTELAGPPLALARPRLRRLPAAVRRWPRAGPRVVDELPEGRARRPPVDVHAPPPSVERDWPGSCLVRRPRAGSSGGCGRSADVHMRVRGLPRSARELEGTASESLIVVPGALACALPPIVTITASAGYPFGGAYRFPADKGSPPQRPPTSSSAARPRRWTALPVASSTRKLLKGLGAPQLHPAALGACPRHGTRSFARSRVPAARRRPSATPGRGPPAASRRSTDRSPGRCRLGAADGLHPSPDRRGTPSFAASCTATTSSSPPHDIRPMEPPPHVPSSPAAT